MRGLRYRLVALVTMIAVAVTCVWPVSALAELQTSTESHAIAVAYDNSGSMYWDFDQADTPPIDRWCNAKYSMEVLAAMLGEQDSLTIYTMDRDDPIIALDGSQPMAERVGAVHNTGFGHADGTYIDPIMHAIASLDTSDADKKYLIVTTDGDFNSDRNGYAEQLLMPLDGAVSYYINQASENDITTIYLAISSDAPIDADPKNNIYVEEPDSTQILSTVLEVSNMVFGRAELPTKYWDANTGKITFDVPMGTLVVLAQGSKASLGKLSGAVDVPGVQSPVSYSQMDDSEKQGLVNERLRGVVGVYDAKMPKGEYTLDVSGAESIAIYYMPCIDIAVDLQSGDSVTSLSATEATEIYEGEYTASITLLDPFTGEVVDSPLLDGAETTLEVENGGTSAVLAPGESFELVPGDVSINGIADVPGGVRVTQHYLTSEVTAELRGLVLDTSGVPTQARYDKPGTSKGNPEGVVLVSKEDGTEITPEEWAIMQLSYESADNLEWELERDPSQIGVFNVKLASCGKKPNLIEWVRIHLLPHVTGGAPRTTTFSAQVSSTMSNLGGSQRCTTSLTGLFMWWIWVILGIITALITRLITKPRLPHMAPALDLGDGAGARPIDGRLQLDTGLLSLRAHRGHFGATAMLVDDRVVREKVGLDAIHLVAVGRKRFKITEPSLSALRAMQEAGAEVGCLKASGESETLSANSSFDIIRGTNYCTVFFNRPQG